MGTTLKPLLDMLYLTNNKPCVHPPKSVAHADILAAINAGLLEPCKSSTFRVPLRIRLLAFIRREDIHGDAVRFTHAGWEAYCKHGKA